MSILCKRARKLSWEADKLWVSRKYREAKELYLQAFRLAQANVAEDKGFRFIFAVDQLLEAAECAYQSQDYEEATGHFLAAADLFDSKGYFQLVVKALKRAADCQETLGNRSNIEELARKMEATRNRMPHNLEECFADMERNMTSEEIERFKKYQELVGINIGLGIAKDRWGLLDPESDLSKYFHNMGIFIPDEMGRKIVTEFHRHLNSKTETEHLDRV
jgi:tetratricopeptide (TPR) repeat protein